MQCLIMTESDPLKSWKIHYHYVDGCTKFNEDADFDTFQSTCCKRQYFLHIYKHCPLEQVL